MLHQNQRRLFVFDLDDTLMWNAWTYGVAFQRFYDYLLEIWSLRVPALGYVASFSEDIDAKLGKEINPATGKEYGFSMERFPTSLVETYRYLCEDMGFGRFEEATARHIYDIGMSAFNRKNYKKAGLVSGAKEVLDYFKKEGHYLALITKGDERVQMPKIEVLGLERWFRWTRIVDSKTTDTFIDTANLFGRNFSGYKYSVGNSFYSDIHPAIEAGFQGVYIPCPTWSVEKLPDDCDQEKATVLPEIKHVLNLCAQEVI